MKSWKENNMSERRLTILSTTSLPFDRIHYTPDHINIRVIPFIKIVPRASVELKPVLSAYASEKVNVVFTSRHAVKIVRDCLKEIPDWKIFCIRNETRMAVEKYFGQESIAQFAENALKLSQLMIAENIREALFFCGDQRMNILPDSVRKYGILLKELIVYDTLLTPRPIDDAPDIVLFFSPTAVRSFFSINELSSETTVFAMGETTASELKKFTANKIIISPKSDKASVFNMAVEYAASHPII
jgi:uroporphyrinogen-III synthase